MYGTALKLTLTIADTPFANKAAAMIQEDLAELGIPLEINSLSLGKLYAQGPDGIIFGQKFDTALFTWAAGSNPCAIYLSDQIPSESNHWIGTNIGGFKNEEFDQACLFPEHSTFDAGKIFANELPVIPLYFNISVGASANNICGIADRIGSRSMLWNMEGFSRSESNCAVSQWNDIYH